MNTSQTTSAISGESEVGRHPRRVLTLFDCICIIVGTIIGAGIFKMPASVSANVPSVFWLAAVWIFGGIVALIGALCFAELTTTYPDRGGDYGYLKRAYHRRVGFAFSWAAFWVIRPGNIGAMAMIFGDFAADAIAIDKPVEQGLLAYLLAPVSLAIVSVVAISCTNLLGIFFGKTTQNVLTVAKVVGILLIVAAAFLFGPKSDPVGAGEKVSPPLVQQYAVANPASVPTSAMGGKPEPTPASNPPTETKTGNGEIGPLAETAPSIWASFWLAMVFVMFTFGGWNDIAFVASEVKKPDQNLLRSLILGTSCVLLIYLLVNFALVAGLGFERMSQIGRDWGNPTTVLVQERMGEAGLTLFAVLVCISCLGSINAMIFTSPRIYWATAVDYPTLGWLAGSSANEQGWWRAMVLQGAVTILFIRMFAGGGGGIDNIVAATAPFFWLFLALTVISLAVLRWRFPGKFTGYRVPLYPVLPLIFVAACIFMMYQACLYMFDQKLWIWTLLIGVWVLCGVGLSFVLDGNPETVNIRDSSGETQG